MYREKYEAEKGVEDKYEGKFICLFEFFFIVNSEKKEIRRFLCLYVYEEYFYLKRD